MRKTSEEFNSDTIIENIWELCGEEQTVNELPYWETINQYLEKLESCVYTRFLILQMNFTDAGITYNNSSDTPLNQRVDVHKTN